MNAQLKSLDYCELLLGCGEHRLRRVWREGGPRGFANVTTLDIDPSHKPDVLHDLNVTPWPFQDSSYDEIHAYEVLEHLGDQGDYRSFFRHFYEIWRILKPNGMLYASVPMWDSPWAWSDPGHCRIISKYSLIFLNQDEYAQVGQTAITDYRHLWHGDLKLVGQEEKEHIFSFVLKAYK